MASLSDKEVSEWLKQLQKQSWELELLVTGFSIFLLMFIPEYADLYREKLIAEMTSAWVAVPIITLRFISLAAIVIIVNLILHVIVRGVWVGYVGLSSVPSKHGPSQKNSEDRQFLPLLDKLDNIASSIFSFSFLISAFVLSICVYILVVSLATFALHNVMENKDSYFLVLGILAVVFLLIPVVVLLGNLPRIRFISVVTVPITQFCRRTLSLLSLFFTYRPLYQFLLVKYGGFKVKGLVLFYLFALAVLSSTYGSKQPYLELTSETTFRAVNYDNLRPANTAIKKISLENDQVSGAHVRLFVHYSEDLFGNAESECPDLPESSVGSSFSLFGVIQTSTFDNDSENRAKAYLECFPKLVEVRLDGETVPAKWHYMIHPNMKERGYVTYLNVADLELGPHLVTIVRHSKIDDKDFHIPFIKTTEP